jgi:AcrR family transcriptional regulator
MVRDVKGRSYDNSRREAGARETRRAIVQAAWGLFVDLRYSATTFAAIGERAGVSAQTVYAHFKTKHDLLKEVIDQAVAGDDAPVAIAERAAVAAILAEADPAQKLLLHAAMVTSIMRRAAPLDQVLRSAAAVDQEAAELLVRSSQQRRAGMGQFAAHLSETGHLREDLTVKEAAERLGVLTDPEIYRLTVLAGGWTPLQYQEWLVELVTASLCRR